jgi:hypothetical protein
VHGRDCLLNVHNTQQDLLLAEIDVRSTKRDSARGTLIDIRHMITDSLNEIRGEFVVVMDDVYQLDVS